jgi:hypothetical protein
MSSSKKTVVLVVIPFLLVMLICSLVSKPVVFADVKKGPVGCTPLSGSALGNGLPGLIRCCQTTTDSEGIEITLCTVCDDTQPPSHCTKPFTLRGESSPPSNAGTVQPPSTPPPPSNETHVNNPPGNIGTVQQPPSTPPPSNAIPPPSVLPSPTKQQTLTTTCPNGLLPDANGNCPTSTTTNTNQQGELTSNDNNNNPTSEHHKGSNQPTQTGGGGQELTATKKHKGSKTDQGTTQPP